jgi:hypothetical protein
VEDDNGDMSCENEVEAVWKILVEVRFAVLWLWGVSVVVGAAAQYHTEAEEGLHRPSHVKDSTR